MRYARVPPPLFFFLDCVLRADSSWIGCSARMAGVLVAGMACGLRGMGPMVQELAAGPALLPMVRLRDSPVQHGPGRRAFRRPALQTSRAGHRAGRSPSGIPACARSQRQARSRCLQLCEHNISGCVGQVLCDSRLQ